MLTTGEYNVDICLCIDATASMSSCIEMTKEKALSIYPALQAEMASTQKTIGQLRIKVILFRDYGVDPDPLVESEFFTLPEDNAAFQEFVDGITVSGGGDLPENALEAIAKALQSDWTTEGKKRRHIVLVFTDAEALPLGERASAPGYPTDIPADLAGLSAWWEKTDQSFASTYDPAAGRLVVFAPKVSPWTDEELGVWNRVVLQESTAGEGLEDTSFEEVISFLSASILKTPV
jgi:hypothetical protein